MAAFLVRWCVALWAAAMFSSSASAAWHKAESERFVVYSDSRAEDLRKFAQMLERFHFAMSLESGREVPNPSPSNRLTVYMVGTRDNLRDIHGGKSSTIAGFYIPRAQGSVTFVPNIKIGTRASQSAQIGSRRKRGNDGAVDGTLRILLHEYAHHFLIGSSRHAMPRWLSEGAAEYFSSARFNEDGSVDIGLPNNDRAYEISQAAPVPLRELFDYDLYRVNRGNRYDAFYGRSWLLYHFLRFNSARKGQLTRYWKAVAQGTDSLQAAENIFGDLDGLEREVKSYGRQRNMPAMRFARQDIQIGQVSVAELPKGHAEMMEVIMRSKRGVTKTKAQKILLNAQSIAKRYPQDAAVQAALAEAEFDAGNNDAAIAAADRALSINPEEKQAFVQKGYALFRKAEEMPKAEQAAAFAQAMKPFEALNALEADHTQPLIHFYYSFVRRGVKPPDGARFALERATQLAPFDKRLAIEVAAIKMAEGDPVVARYVLAPVAADPHGEDQAAFATGLIKYLEKAEDGKPLSFAEFKKRWDAQNDEKTGE
jgi:Flp pilus assembly protein TadD